MIAITGATGQLGHYVIKSLMKTVPASQIVAIVRNPAKAQALAAQGITVRQADYGDEAALTSALQGVEKLLLISSSEVGQRAPQHRNVINAAKVEQPADRSLTRISVKTALISVLVSVRYLIR